MEDANTTPHTDPPPRPEGRAGSQTEGVHPLSIPWAGTGRIHKFPHPGWAVPSIM